MSKSSKSKSTAPQGQQPSGSPSPKLGGVKPSSSLPSSLGGGNALHKNALGGAGGGLYGASGSHGVPTGKAGGKPSASAAMKPAQKSGGKPTGAPRRTAG